MPIRQLPDPREIPGLFVDAVKVRGLGWRHGDLFFAFATEPGPDDRFHAFIRRLPGTPVRGMNFATQNEAEAWAVAEYGRAAYGTSSITWSTPKGKPSKSN